MNGDTAMEVVAAVNRAIEHLNAIKHNALMSDRSTPKILHLCGDVWTEYKQIINLVLEDTE